MPIYRCGACGFIGEEIAAAPGTQLPCAKCAAPSTLFATPFYVQRLAERYLSARRELDALRLATTSPMEESAPERQELSAQNALTLDNLHNTGLLATEVQHKPLHDWFTSRQIEPAFVLEAVDTTGFFDETATEIGTNYEALRDLIEEVRYACRKDFSWKEIELTKYDETTTQKILAFCRQAYGHTLFSKYAFKKQTQMLSLGIQPAVIVRKFFMGAWLEWYALTTLVNLCLEKKRSFSCARNVTLTNQSGEKRELDVATLISGRTPIIVECKTGEFRADIDKYVKLRQRLGMDRSQFIICSPDLADEQATGLAAMYDLTFVNLQSLSTHLRCML